MHTYAAKLIELHHSVLRWTPIENLKKNNNSDSMICHIMFYIKCFCNLKNDRCHTCTTHVFVLYKSVPSYRFCWVADVSKLMLLKRMHIHRKGGITNTSYRITKYCTWEKRRELLLDEKNIWSCCKVQLQKWGHV